ncbi:DUF1232 domain-containing protein [Oscillibacter sp.]|uniref:YkvA family protein n=1 Tax=Oscillibacter sp. TaxID=1945593 RepID=UPI0033965FCF
MSMDNGFNEQKAQKELEKGYEPAKKLLNDPDKFEKFLQRLEMKLKVIPLAGDRLANIPIMVSLIRSFVKKEYTDIPIGSVIAVTSALIYFVSPIDILPDSIPFLGYIDDAAVIAVCWKLVESDVEEYVKWRDNNGMVLNV